MRAAATVEIHLDPPDQFDHPHNGRPHRVRLVHVTYPTGHVVLYGAGVAKSGRVNANAIPIFTSRDRTALPAALAARIDAITITGLED
jgi:hypothetical protein